MIYSIWGRFCSFFNWEGADIWPQIRLRKTPVLYVCLQQDEVSDDLLTFHEAVNQMQELEEEIIDDQKALIDVSYDTELI